MLTKNLFLTQEDLIKRAPKLRKLLRPLYHMNGGPPAMTLTKKNEYYLGAADTGYQDKLDHRQWRFKTLNKSFYAEYFERWIYKEAKDIWRLERAYLHIKKIIDHNNLIDYLALHCDPLIMKDENHYIYKVGPHLHIECAEYPIPKSHFALFLIDIEKILASVDDLTEALSTAIQMIKEQVLEIN